MGNTEQPEGLLGRRLLRTHVPGMCYVSELEARQISCRERGGEEEGLEVTWQ